MRSAVGLCALLLSCASAQVDVIAMLPREPVVLRAYEGGESVLFSLPSDWEILPASEPDESLRLVVGHSADNTAQLLLLRFTEPMPEERLLGLVQEKYFQGPIPISTRTEKIHNLSGLRAEFFGSLGPRPTRGLAYVFSWRESTHIFIVSTHESVAEKNMKTISGMLESLRGL